MNHSGATVMANSVRESSEFPRIDMPPGGTALPNPRFGRLNPPAHGPAPHILSRTIDIAKRAYPVLLVLSVFLSFLLATFAIRFAIWAAFRR
jgi:hypothetical protein